MKLAYEIKKDKSSTNQMAQLKKKKLWEFYM